MAAQIGTVKGLVVGGLAFWIMVRCMSDVQPPPASAPAPVPPTPYEAAVAFAEYQKRNPPSPPSAPAKAPAPVTPSVPAKSKKEALADQIEMRKFFAQSTEARFLENGLSVTITTRGKDATTLHFEYVMVTKAFAHQTQHERDWVEAGRLAGFKKMVLTDGFRETYSFDF